MNRLLYEHSTPCRGYLIIPFVFGYADSQTIYSYRLLSEIGHNGRFHKLENPANLYSSSLEKILAIAREHLNKYSDLRKQSDYFKRRYTYRDNLIIVFEQSGKYFYDHYLPKDLVNVAAPKLFRSEQECLDWIKQGIDRLHSKPSIL